MEYIQADIWVRFQRMQGHAVHFVCADDTHGAPIMLKAEAEGISPAQLVTRIAAIAPKDLKGFHISFDYWIRPTRRKTSSCRRTSIAPEGARADRQQGGRAVLRPGEGDVPARPLCQGPVPVCGAPASTATAAKYRTYMRPPT